MENNQSKNLVLGVLVAGAIGAAAYFMYKSAKQPPLIKRVGKTISHVGEMLENCDLDCESLLNKAEDSMTSACKSSSGKLGDLLDIGLKIWKQFK